MLARRQLGLFLKNNVSTEPPPILQAITNAEKWKKRTELRRPKMQRDETIAPKVYYAPEWNLEAEDDFELTPLKKYGMTPKKWEYYNQTVWPVDYIVPETGLPKSREVFHVREQIHFSPKRAWQACELVCCMNVDEAILQLQLQQNKGCLMLAEVLEEAKKRASHEFGIEFNSGMHVAEAFAIQSNIIKGVRRHARGNFNQIKYRYIDLYVRLEEGDGPQFKGRLKPKNGWEKADEYIDYLRNRSVKYSI
uniref:39S ribosomal protein L22, mitochondrial n=2 Tax=Rhabditophanes sp. KR3021 TaxID=114890 RepID=A0AC35U406_9BILA